MNAEQLVTLIKAALADIKAQDVVALPVSGMSSFADFIVIASGTSTRHVKSIADRVIEQVKAAGMKPLGIEGDAQADWVLVDLGDVVLHVMTPATRQLYDLEKLWTPAPAATMKTQAPAPAAATDAVTEKKPVARKPRAATVRAKSEGTTAARPRTRRKPVE